MIKINNLKIAYIGGGSKNWAKVFMNDLALDGEIEGKIALYDIDEKAALRNKKIGDLINLNKECKSKWKYEVCNTIESALDKADFVIISILPGTFEEMRVDVHLPQNYQIFQTVGDTVGPGGVMRAMRTVPLYENFAKKIKEICPKAWVINYTNPMNICVKTLYDVFPEIKAFGCCHEVFHAQEFLTLVVKEKLNLLERPKREEIIIDVSGINHFTWITKASYKEYDDILPWINDFYNNHFEEGIYEGKDPLAFKYNTFAYGNKVKMDLYKRYNVLGAAGDRHLVEFMNNKWYLKDLDTISNWKISITTVDSRIKDCQNKIEQAELESIGKKEIVLQHSDEEGVAIIKALLGLKDLKTNVNYVNNGQVSGLRNKSIVESNCIFSKDKITPINASPLYTDVLNLVSRNLLNIDNTYEGIKERNLKKIFASFVNESLCSNLTIEEARKMFNEMLNGTKKYLLPYYNELSI